MSDKNTGFSLRSGIEREQNPLFRRLVELRRRSAPLLDLTSGNPSEVGLAHAPGDVLPELTRPSILRYEPVPFGPSFVREAVSATLAEMGQRVAPERIVLTASTSEGYAFLLKLLCDPGDEVLVPAPSYPLLEHLARFESVRTRSYRLAYDGAFHIDFDSLRKGVGPRTRAILCVNPNNPTGNYVARDELERLAAFGLPIISDEVFFDYPLEAKSAAARSLLEAPGPLVFVLSGLSKLLGLPQMKLGWVALGGDEAHVSEALSRLELIADAFLSPSAPVLHAAPAWLGRRKALQARLRARLRSNLATLTEVFRDSPVSRLPVPGGWYAVLRLPDTRSDEAWTLALLDHAGVVVQPGYFFDWSGPPHVVLSLITEEQTFAEGATRLRDFVASE